MGSGVAIFELSHIANTPPRLIFPSFQHQAMSTAEPLLDSLPAVANEKTTVA
jgi:hypothetical protein